MPKWKQDAKEFTVSVNCHEVRGCNCQVPKPIMDMLGNPHKIKYVIRGQRIEFENGDIE